MAEPKKPATRTPRQPPRPQRVVLEAKLRIPRGIDVRRPTKEQIAKLEKAFKSDLIASIGIGSDVAYSRLILSTGRRPKR